MASKRIVALVISAIGIVAISVEGRGSATVPPEQIDMRVGTMVFSEEAGISQRGGFPIIGFSTAVATPAGMTETHGFMVGDTSHDEFVVERITDNFSPAFYRYAHAQVPIKKISITIATPSEGGVPILWTLQNAYVTRYEHDWTTMGTYPSETLHFGYRKICQRPMATPPGSQICYDVARRRISEM